MREDGLITIINYDLRNSLLNGIIFNLDTTSKDLVAFFLLEKINS